jgi:hypothetical protein
MVRRFLLLPLFIISLSGFVGAQGTNGSQADAEIEKEILKVEGERDQAIQKRDMATLERIHADGFVFTNTHGRVLTKAQYLNQIRTGDIKFLSFEQSDYQFRIHGNTVILTGLASSVVEYHGMVNRIPRRFTSVYIKLDGQWRLVAHQATLIVKDPLK